jgi:hypothetical protein
MYLTENVPHFVRKAKQATNSYLRYCQRLTCMLTLMTLLDRTGLFASIFQNCFLLLLCFHWGNNRSSRLNWSVPSIRFFVCLLTEKHSQEHEQAVFIVLYFPWRCQRMKHFPFYHHFVSSLRYPSNQLSTIIN